MTKALRTMTMVAGLLVAGLALADVELRSRTENGATISGDFRFRVTVTAGAGVRDVEFYVGDDLKGNDSSTPYEFTVDTLEYDDGPLSVRFVAYSTEGEKGELKLNVTIDNGLAKGVDFHVGRAKEFLTDAKWDEAMLAARVALKVKPGHAPARIVLARANLGKGVLDQAQRYVEEVLAGDPGNGEALTLLSTIRIQRAFTTLGREGTSRAEVLGQIRDSLVAAVEARNKVRLGALDAFGEVTDANRLQYADLAIQAGRYSLATNTLEPLFNRDDRNLPVVHRLLYAMIRSDRIDDANRVLARYKRGGELDAYGYALEAVLYARAGDSAKSDASLREAILSDGDLVGVKTTRAYLALRDSKNAVLGQIVNDLASEQFRPEVQYYLCALSHRLNRNVEARQYLERGLLAEPANQDLFIERANEAVLFAIRRYATEEDKAKEQYEIADVFVDAAIAAKPDSPIALAAKATVQMLLGNNAEGLRYAEMAAKSGPTSPLAHYALAGAFAASKRAPDGAASLRRSGQLDPALEGKSFPTPAQVWQYMDGKGRAPVITAPK
ncbi:MAG: hypothetical protein KIS66_05710 [Fimbriimonadaceae bacterium]|nr:hypothetical protein [Fimbriimonadaceae bacterium]